MGAGNSAPGRHKLGNENHSKRHGAHLPPHSVKHGAHLPPSESGMGIIYPLTESGMGIIYPPSQSLAWGSSIPLKVSGMGHLPIKLFVQESTEDSRTTGTIYCHRSWFPVITTC